ncbi:MAG: Phosphate transport ATP-binding protein PstB [uncultured Rubrobacteraceae bacterium]|uniref:Phosphate transport ATP-binding protein PstB n=1 Tax=uncultured Rubrobacteraceae bacterium TaxID=349277 RepID=A0A6J4NGL7_9ACTN|nr:MAG: Phosphate transport ATP-binding protein PstB [uncultured Rubrobacteraceae bacterium]
MTQSERTREEQRLTGVSRDRREGRRDAGRPPAGDNGTLGMKIQDLSAFYGGFKAVTDVSMDIRANKVTALIGPSGCGKSTYIRCLNRMHEVIPGARAEGSVTLGDQDIYAKGSDPVVIRRRVGMVFQKPNPFSKSIYENVAWGARINGFRGDVDELVERSLRQAALWDEVKDRLKESGYGLSGGQQQRLCIARTLAVEPEVILMDEPASALDPVSTQKIEDTMAELKKSYTVVIVTHNMQQAARISDYTGFFYIVNMGDPGRLWEFDETEKIFSNPERKETEDYVTGRFG